MGPLPDLLAQAIESAAAPGRGTSGMTASRLLFPAHQAKGLECDGHPAGTVGARQSGRLRLQHWEAEAPNAIMGWTVFQPRREQWTRQRYQSLRSRPQLENSGGSGWQCPDAWSPARHGLPAASG